MKRYQITETLIMGYVDVPDDIDESNIWNYLDENAAWPDDEEVADHEAILCEFPIRSKEIISEPGDLTRYEYTIEEYASDMFVFVRERGSIQYPPAILSPPGKKWSEDEIRAEAKKSACNPWTIVECIRAIRELQNGNM